jgi:hypothetical protein
LKKAAQKLFRLGAGGAETSTAKLGKGKASFCEQKEAKKLYLLWAVGVVGDTDSGPE